MLYGAFTNATQAMQTMDWAMGSISQNIANVNTNGYKEKETLFKTVMSESHTSPAMTQNSPNRNTATSGLDIFGVRPVDRNLITRAGTITPTNTWSDMAINGRGFFVVTQPDSSGAPQTSGTSSNTLYTRAGNFQQRAVNGNSYFTTPDGNFLMGWQADAQGNIAGVKTTAGNPLANSVAVTSQATATAATAALTPVYANIGSTLDGYSTSAIQLVANLPSNAALTKTTQNFTDSTSITDGFGTAQDLSMAWTRVSGDTWSVAFSLPGNPASGSVGTITGSPVTVTMDASGTITAPTTSPSGTGFADLTIDWSAGPTLQTTASINLNSNKAASAEAIAETIAIYDDAFNSHNLTLTFEHSANGQWYMRFQPVASEGTVSALSATTSGAATTYANSIPITFDGAGNVLTPTTASFTVDWTATGAGSNTVTLDMTKLTQFSADNATRLGVKVIQQDGYAKGTMDRVDIATTGEVIAHFDSGRTRTLFMVPVATFVSADNLDPISGTLFRATEQAGKVTVDAISKQGSGAIIQPQAVETSNVDIADQFTKMIVTQKAYSVNANVFKTADEMTQSVRDLI